MARKGSPQADWSAAVNPDVLLTLAGARPAVYSGGLPADSLAPPLARRLRLFGCACVRMVWHLLPDDARNAVVISERVADGRATEADLEAAGVRMTYGPVSPGRLAINAAGWAATGYWATGRTAYFWNPVEAAREAAKALATRAAGPAPPGGSPVAVNWQESRNRAFFAARAHQAELVRDIFPPPDRSVHALRLEREWLTDTALMLARQADDTGEYGALPILADALQDAGCDNEFILERCRAESGLHSRGNWVVDLLLGRE